MLTQAEPKVTVALEAKPRAPQVSTPPADTPGKPVEPPAEKPRVAEELLIEEVSIDGMCGVY